MAKKAHNWKASFTAFKKAELKDKITLKKWCEKNNLSYNSARREFKKIRDQVITKADLDSENDHESITPPESNVPNASSKADKAKGRKRNPNMARPGNSSARIHGLFSKRFGEAWELATLYDHETRYKVLQAQGIQVEMFCIEYQTAIDEIDAEVKADERAPTEEEFERIIKMQKHHPR